MVSTTRITEIHIVGIAKKEPAMKDRLTDTFNLVKAMEENYIAYARYFSRVPYIELRESPEITLVMSKEIRLWNIVTRSHLAPTQVTTTIEAVTSHFEALDLPLTWHILPSTQPSNLAEYLEEYDFLFFDEEPHMVIEPAKHVLDLPHIPGFTIERVTDTAHLAQWHQATVGGFFPNTPSLGQLFLDAYTLLGFDPRGPFLHYTGYMNGEPVAASTLLFTEGMAGIYDVCTIPSARGKGFGTAITLAPLLEAQARSYRYVCLQATNMGYPLYERMGFREQYRERKYLWRSGPSEKI